MTLTVRSMPGSNQFEVEATTTAGVRELWVVGSWPVVVAAMAAFVESLR